MSNLTAHLPRKLSRDILYNSYLSVWCIARLLPSVCVDKGRKLGHKKFKVKERMKNAVTQW